MKTVGGLKTSARFKNQRGPRKCSAHTLEFKVNTLNEWKAKGFGPSEASVYFNVHASTLRNWRRSEAELRQEQNSRYIRRRAGAGRPPQTKALEDNIVLYVKDMHRWGKPVSRSAIIAYTAWRYKPFRKKTYEARHMWVSRFIVRHGLADRVKQHYGSILAEDLEAIRVDFARNVNRYIREHAFSPSDVWNLDQTGVSYDLRPKKVVVPIGTNKVSSLNLENTQKSFRLTAILTINAAGGKERPFIILPAKRGGTIERNEIPTLPRDASYVVQENGWTDEQSMLDYVQSVLQPIAQRVRKPQLLLLDALSTHMTLAVRFKLEELGFHWIYVPPGPTSVCQPLDVGIIGPFKARIRSLTAFVTNEREWAKQLKKLLLAREEHRDSYDCELIDDSELVTEENRWIVEGLPDDDDGLATTDELLAGLGNVDATITCENAEHRRRVVSTQIIASWGEITDSNVIRSFKTIGLDFGFETHQAIVEMVSKSVNFQEKRLERDGIISKPRKRLRGSLASLPDADSMYVDWFLSQAVEVEISTSKTDVVEDVLNDIISKVEKDAGYDEWKQAMYEADSKVTRINKGKKKQARKATVPPEKKHARKMTPPQEKKQTRTSTMVAVDAPDPNKQANAPVIAEPKRGSPASFLQPRSSEPASQIQPQLAHDRICQIEHRSFVRNTPTSKLVVTRDDLSCLNPKTWLNDIVISYFIYRYIPSNPDILSLDCQFFGNLTMNAKLRTHGWDGYLQYCGMTDTLNWATHRYVQIPINMNSHWSFVVIENAMGVDGKTIFYHVDSLPGYHDSAAICSSVIKFLANEKLRKMKQKHSMQYKTMKVQCNPTQDNGYDCGVFMVYYMRALAHVVAADSAINLGKQITRLCSGLDGKKCLQFRKSVLSLLGSDGRSV